MRTLFLHRGFSLLTLLGLSVGIAMSIFVLEYVFYQFSFDKHYERSEDIYRVISRGSMENEKVNAALTPMVAASELVKYPGIESVTRIIDESEVPVESDYGTTFESEILYADSSFFKVFSRPFLLGNSERSHADSSSVFISRSAASRLFGNRNPLGEKIRINQNRSFTIQGVFQDVPENSHLQYDFVLPFSLIEQQMKDYYGESYTRIQNSWFSLFTYIYVKIRPEGDVNALEKEFMADILPEMERQDRALFSGDMKTDLNFSFQRLDQIYLFSGQDFEIGKTTNPTYVFVFLGIAFFILLVTAFNFMNLTTARALDRAREAGVRRLFGAKRLHLAGQFISESVLFSLLALFFGLVFVELLLPVFKKLFLVDFFDRSYRQSLNFPVVLMVALAVGVLSGIYPAFVFSRIKAFHLQSGFNRFSAYPGLWVRGLLVMVQVFVAVFVSSAALGMYRQLRYVSDIDVGFETEHLGLLERTRHLGEKTDSVFRIIDRLEGVESISKLYFNPGDPLTIMPFSHSGDSSKMFLLEIYPVDSSFFHTMGAQVETGSTRLSGSQQVVVNSKAAGIFGEGDVVGKNIYTVTSEADERSEFEIKGVITDMHPDGWKETLRPAVFIPAGPDENSVAFALKVKEGYWEQVNSSLQDVWAGADIRVPFKLVTYDEKAKGFYQEDYRYMSLAWAFAILVIIIATLGMTGLVSFLLATRQQVLLLRKITGFPDFHNIRIMFSGFFIFVALGIIFALPVAREVLADWSRTFTVQYRTDYICFIIPPLLMFAIAIAIARYGGRSLLSKMSLHQF